MPEFFNWLVNTYFAQPSGRSTCRSVGARLISELFDSRGRSNRPLEVAQCDIGVVKQPRSEEIRTGPRLERETKSRNCSRMQEIGDPIAPGRCGDGKVQDMSVRDVKL